MKIAEINLKNDVAYINSSSLTTLKLWVSTPPCLKINWALLSDDEKLKIIMEVISFSKDEVPIPENPNEYANTYLNSFGFKSWRKFYEGGSHCSIQHDIENEIFRIVPSIILKDKVTLYGLKNEVKIISGKDITQLIPTLANILYS